MGEPIGFSLYVEVPASAEGVPTLAWRDSRVSPGCDFVFRPPCVARREGEYEREPWFPLI